MTHELPHLIRWEPRHRAPTIDCVCPSCGRTAERRASSWTEKVDGTLTARMSCEPLAEREPQCWRTFDVTVTAGNAGSTPEET